MSKSFTQLTIYFLSLFSCICLTHQQPSPNGCSCICLELAPQKVPVKHQGLGSINYINCYYSVSPQPSATLPQASYLTHLFLPLAHHPHSVLMFTSLPTCPQEHSFLICLFGVWVQAAFYQVMYLRLSYPLPHAALENHGKVLPYSPVSVCSNHT